MHERSCAVWLVAALAAGCQHPPRERPHGVAARPGPRLAAVELFDTDPGTRGRVAARHARALKAALDNGTEEDAERLVTELRADGDYGYVEASLITYYETHASYLTIDVVRRQDAERRMPFRTAPTGTYPDPGGLIAAWDIYVAKVMGLADQQRLWRPPADCPSFHCLGDPRQPELQALADPFRAAPAHLGELARILRDDARASWRGNAAYLLAYGSDGRVLVDEMLAAMHDSSSLVRNNAMRVLAEIALHHPEVDIPLEPVIAALSFPSTSDRNKAAATLHRLVSRPGGDRLYDRVAREAGEVLLAMLALAQPNNHDYAYKILTQISGERFGERDDAAWRRWLGLRAQPLEQ